MKKVITVLIIFAFITNLKAEKPIEKKKLIAINNSKPMNWFTDVLDGIASLWQPVWGKYTEGGSTNRSYPLACADRKTLL